MPNEIENIEQSEVKFDKSDKKFLLIAGLVILGLIILVWKILT